MKKLFGLLILCSMFLSAQQVVAQDWMGDQDCVCSLYGDFSHARAGLQILAAEYEAEGMNGPVNALCNQLDKLEAWCMDPCIKNQSKVPNILMAIMEICWEAYMEGSPSEYADAILEHTYIAAYMAYMCYYGMDD